MYIADKDFFLQRVLMVTQQELNGLLDGGENNYEAFSIPKADGQRTIQAVRKGTVLYRVQKNLCKNFLNKIPLPTPVVGFVPNKSYLDFLKPHIGKKYFMRLDIHDFFGSIHIDFVQKQFEEYFSAACQECCEMLAAICTNEGVLPQGALTSPMVSNIVFRYLDQRILKYCQKYNTVYCNGYAEQDEITYTRYADDLLFSSNCVDFSKQLYFHGMIRSILKSSGFQLNDKKIRFGSGEISLSGYVVSDNIHLSRKKLYSINKLIHFFGKTENYADKKYRIKKQLFNEDWVTQINQLRLLDGSGKPKVFTSSQDVLDYLCGYRAFMISILKNNKENDSNMRQISRKVDKVTTIIDRILEG